MYLCYCWLAGKAKAAAAGENRERPWKRVLERHAQKQFPGHCSVPPYALQYSSTCLWSGGVVGNQLGGGPSHHDNGVLEGLVDSFLA